MKPIKKPYKHRDAVIFAIAAFLVMLSFGYALIYYDNDKFERLCREEPTIPQCPKPERMEAL